MKVPIIVVVVLAAIAGYLYGTEQGRLQKDEAIKKIRGKAEDVADAADQAADKLADTGTADTTATA